MKKFTISIDGIGTIGKIEGENITDSLTLNSEIPEDLIDFYSESDRPWIWGYDEKEKKESPDCLKKALIIWLMKADKIDWYKISKIADMKPHDSSYRGITAIWEENSDE